MSTFLQLCQNVARESGTITGTQPAAVTGQTGRLAKVINMVAQAWIDIQNVHDNWLWMRTEFDDTAITQSTGQYTADSWSLSDVGEWITTPKSVWIHLTSGGVGNESELKWIEWDLYRQKYLKGTQTENRPIEFSISPAQEFCFGPVPDATYAVSGEYYATPQALAANGDVPNCPARFHNLIVWKAMLLLHEHDEAVIRIAEAMRHYPTELSVLGRSQLPKMFIGEGAIVA